VKNREGERPSTPSVFAIFSQLPGNRVQAVQKEAKSLPARTYNGETGQFRSVQALVTKVAGK
jgi:hypothetical protein